MINTSHNLNGLSYAFITVGFNNDEMCSSLLSKRIKYKGMNTMNDTIENIAKRYAVKR